jgi:hypothetical protein
VECDRTRVGIAERIKDVGQPDRSQRVIRVGSLNLRKINPLQFVSVAMIDEDVLVRDQRVHPVDRGELLGQRVRHS